MKAAIFAEQHAPMRIEEVDIDRPARSEVLIRTAATGVCHSDVHFWDGHYNLHERFGLPAGRKVVLGHEAAGTVEAVGEGVDYVKPGDRVVVCFSIFCGSCEQCLTGHPARCLHKHTIGVRPPASPPRLSQDGEPVHQHLHLGTYAEQMLVHENTLAKIDDDIPFEHAALLSCAAMTGLGAAINSAQIEVGSTVAVFGCGGVGLSVVHGAALSSARQIIAVDKFDSKLEMAEGFGATHLVNSTADNAVEQIRKLTNRRGVDYAFEAVGLASLLEQAVQSLTDGGLAVLLGALSLDDRIMIEPQWLNFEKRIQSCLVGSNRFRIDIPRYLDLYRQGKLRLDLLLSQTVALEEINDAIHAMLAGEVARSVIVFD